MISFQRGLLMIRSCRAKFIVVYLLLLLVECVFTVKPNDPEKIIQSTKSRYLQMMVLKPDWLKRILEIVKIELNFRQKLHKCDTESCMYSIKHPMPMKQYRFRRSVKEILKKNVEKFDNMIFEKPQRFKFPSIKTIKPMPTSSTESSTTTATTQSSTGKTATPPSDEHMKECQGNYTVYCKNGAKCVYIDLLKEAVCICRKGFTGERCVNFSLPDTVQLLTSHDKERVNISQLSVKEKESITSVVEAVTRFTYDAVVLEYESVKDILDYSLTANEG